MTARERKRYEDKIAEYEVLVEEMREDFEKLKKKTDAALLKWEEKFMRMGALKLGEVKVITADKNRAKLVELMKKIDPRSEKSITIARLFSDLLGHKDIKDPHQAIELIHERYPALDIKTLTDTLVAVGYQMDDDPEWAAIAFGDNKGDKANNT